jgi:stress-induced morphogen
MARRRGHKPVDPDVQAVLDILQPYARSHPDAKIDSYRQNPGSIRVRIIDPSFRGSDLVARDDSISEILRKLPEDIQDQINILLRLTPDETKKSIGNMDFENPIRSPL